MNTILKKSLLTLSTLIPLSTLTPQMAHASCSNDNYIGAICYTGNDFCPRGFVEANGQLLSVSEFTALFSLLFTNYGGDGRTTFGVPDLRGTAAVGVGQGPLTDYYMNGIIYGALPPSLYIDQLPSHKHDINLPVNGTAINNLSITGASVPVASSEQANITIPEGEIYLAQNSSNRNYFYQSVNSGDVVSSMPVSGKLSGTLDGGKVLGRTEAGPGASTPLDVMQPSLVMKACINYDGMYPPRT